MIEDERARAAREHELRNEEIIERILVSGSLDEMKELQAVHGLDDEQLESMRYWARLRHETKGDQPRIDRAKTPEEVELGVYIDYLEPQVLGAVRTFRKKGYKTTYSGFASLGSQQTIWLDEEQSELIPLPEVTKVELEQRYGVKIKIEPGKIWIDCLKTRLTQQDLKEIWDAIAEALPPLAGTS